MSNLDFIYKRHSIRKFKDEVIPMIDLEEIIKAAIHAPSGKNVQNWHFVIIRNKEKINEIVKVVEDKNSEIASKIVDENIKAIFTKSLKYHIAFRNAPCLILVYAGNYKPTGFEEFKAINESADDIQELFNTAPGIQGASAAMENLLLAAASLGYGTCWMTGPNYAAKEIGDVLNFKKEEYSLMALTPIGLPLEEENKSPRRKPVDEVITVIL
ncbi:nitroreductase family protein [Clostridium sp. CM028]|uniref:nitroreductase family protein n=1 Tax=unclassified Clostridium TaxID=2614128 RepID=UPI001C6F392C|nr:MULTISPECIES: nitroreductase family protein [unclassified Clostridium]MBW9143977.1 nitroreductase family protein [Clostridium sp. CM027]MBW9147707.1 nitroreductase family protein [Clostridium sp. CM028]UVE41363.1 nitroreductase family protein [Clostridium sp. CM027]WLC62030.1 nitroreductase family protein [Clostridium sp. CM028]